jgi:predicted O-methyltransferase YrrM
MGFQDLTHTFILQLKLNISIDNEKIYYSDMRRFNADKKVALDRDKALFCYLLCRSLRAARVVEAGTSFGVSTLYLAAAVRDNEVENGVVIGTEYEPEKAAIARVNFELAGLNEFIDLREGDLRQTLQDVGGPVDFMLVDIWEVALPALELVSPRFVHDPTNRFRTMTLPFDGGFELSVRV